MPKNINDKDFITLDETLCELNANHGLQPKRNEIKDINNIKVPAAINGEKIEYIDSFAFWRCKNLKNIEFSSEINFIGQDAFSGCTYLESVKLPNEITFISHCTFHNCTHLKEIIIPPHVEEIRENAFFNCRKLEKVMLPDELKYIKKGVFKKCQKLKSIELPKGILSIESTAFDGCKNLQIAFNGTEEQLSKVTINDNADYIFKTFNIEIFPVKELNDYIEKVLNDEPFSEYFEFINNSQKKYAKEKLNNMIKETIDLNKKLKLLSVYDDIEKCVPANFESNIVER